MKEEAVESLRSSMKFPSALAFSGGIDSSFLAFLSKDEDVEYMVVGLPDSHDIMWAEHAAELLNIPVEKIILDEDEVVESAIVLSELLETDSILVISFELPLFFIARETEKRYVITGQGADELFGGYNRYGKMEKEELERNMEKDLEELIQRGILRDRKIARYFGKELITPYLSEKFIMWSKNYSAAERRGADGKFLLRDMAEKSGLPSELTTKKKKAAQYGSGIMKVLKKHRNETISK